MSYPPSVSRCRLWLAMLLLVTTRRATDLGCLHFPFIDEEPALRPGGRDKRSREQITGTGIVILGLLEVIFAGFLVGSTHHSLHPVWKVIIMTAVVGITVSALRLRRLIKRPADATPSPGSDPILNTPWPAVSRVTRQAEV